MADIKWFYLKRTLERLTKKVIQLENSPILTLSEEEIAAADTISMEDKEELETEIKELNEEISELENVWKLLHKAYPTKATVIKVRKDLF